MAERFLITFGLLLMSVADCGHTKPTPQPLPPGSPTCFDACMNSSRLLCPDANSCPYTCTANLEKNHPAFVACMIAAGSCDEITKCDM